MSVEFENSIDLNKNELQNACLQQISSDPSTAVEGQLWYRNDEHRPRVNDGTENQKLAYISDLEEHAITSGVISVPGPEWVLKTAPNVITMASCQARLYDNANWVGYPKTYTIPAKDFTLVDGQDSMLIIAYNGGSPEYQIVDAWNFTAYNLSDNCLVYRLWYVFGTIHSASLDSIGNGLCEKQALRLGQTNYYARTGNVGLDIGETSTPVARTVTITAANVWAGPLPITVASYNSSTDALGLLTKNAGVWTRTSVTQWTNDSYNDNAGLITMTNNCYGVVWLYRSIGDTKECFMVLGKNQYTSAGDAATEPVRKDLPFILLSHCMLVGRYIFQKSATSATTIQSAFDAVFQGVASGSVAASSVTFVPTGSISATDVQAAIAELDSEVVYKAGVQTVSGLKAFTGYLTADRTDTSNGGFIQFGRPSDNGKGAAVGYASTDTSNALFIKNSSGNGAINIITNSNTPGTIRIGKGDFTTGTVSDPWVTIDSGSMVLKNLANGSNSITFVPTADVSNSYKNSIQWDNFGSTATTMFIGRRDGVAGNGEEDLRVTQYHATMALGNGCVRIGDQSNATNIYSNGQLAIGARDVTYCGVWHGSIAPASRTNSNCSLFVSADDTYLNSGSATGWIELRNGNSKNVRFVASPVAAGSMSDVTSAQMGGWGTTAWALWGGNVTPSLSNYALYVSLTATELNGATSSRLNVNDTSIATATSAGLSINGTLTASSTANLQGLVYASRDIYCSGKVSADQFYGSVYSGVLTTGTESTDPRNWTVFQPGGQLTGAYTVQFTTGQCEPGTVQYIYFRQHTTTAQTFTISSNISVTFRQSGVNASGTSRVVSGVSTLGAYYMIKFVWISATLCIISVDAA